MRLHHTFFCFCHSDDEHFTILARQIKKLDLVVEMEKVYFRCYVVHSLCLTRQVQLSSTEAVKSFNGIQRARSTLADKTIFHCYIILRQFELEDCTSILNPKLNFEK